MIEDHLQCNICSHQPICKAAEYFRNAYDSVENVVDIENEKINPVKIKFSLSCNLFLKKKETEKLPEGISMR